MTGVGGITLGLKMWSAVGSFSLLSPNYLDIMQATGASIGVGRDILYYSLMELQLNGSSFDSQQR